MLHLRWCDRDEAGGWTRPRYDGLHGGEGVGEVRFEVNNIVYRPLGFFGPTVDDFTFLYFATEKSRRFVPPNALTHAIDRMNIVKAHPEMAVLVKGRWHQ
jgi:hypothetical protein